MKTIKVTLIASVLIALSTVLVSAAVTIPSRTATTPTINTTIRPSTTTTTTSTVRPITNTPSVQTINPNLIKKATSEVDTSQLKPGDSYEDGYVSQMNVSVGADFTAKTVYIKVSDTKTYNSAQNKTYGFTYPDMTITIQRKAPGEIKFSDIGSTQYTTSSYTPYGSKVTTTSGSASFTDSNVKSGKEYKYRVKHTYQSKIYYTLPKSVTFPIRDGKSLKLKIAKRVDLYFEDTWVPEDDDVYKYELQRQLGSSGYNTVSEVDPKNKFISDVIVDPAKGCSYYYVITATCTNSSDSLKIGKSVTSDAIKVNIED
jgi:hypothetical protein